MGTRYSLLHFFGDFEVSFGRSTSSQGSDKCETNTWAAGGVPRLHQICVFVALTLGGASLREFASKFVHINIARQARFRFWAVQQINSKQFAAT